MPKNRRMNYSVGQGPLSSPLVERPEVEKYVQREKKGRFWWLRPSFSSGTAVLRTVMLWGSFFGILVKGGQFVWESWPRDPKAIFIVLPNITRYAQSHERNAAADSVADDFWDGITEGVTRIDGSYQLELKIDSKPPEIIKIIAIDDGPDPKDTISRISEHRQHYNCLMILGHETSTLAKNVWRDYYKDANIPVLLLGPTNPIITEDDYLSDARVLLRLLPNDSKQIELIASIVSGKYKSEKTEASPRSVLIVTDRGNPVYANYITTKLIQALPKDVQYCGSVEVSTTCSLLPEFDRIQRLGPNVIVFVGMGDAAQAFVQGLERQWCVSNVRKHNSDNDPTATVSFTDGHDACTEWLSTVEFVFTDGCASAGFHRFLTNRPRNIGHTDYVISTMPPGDQESMGTTLGELRAFNFKPTGKAAILLANHLAYDARRAGSLSAEGILAQARNLRNLSKIQAEDPSHPACGNKILPLRLQEFQFDKMGDNVKWGWHVYRRDGVPNVFVHVGESE